MPSIMGISGSLEVIPGAKCGTQTLRESCRTGSGIHGEKQESRWIPGSSPRMTRREVYAEYNGDIRFPRSHTWRKMRHPNFSRVMPDQIRHPW
ncbi:hypothetical protein OO006_05270 [Prosthecochloris sp. SCSIO W1101]|uniref:hypothetical protein n=1 Tax=Prosthecochloris sp. SCSIO W1101 TaxID=2992242 RepID=UPI00223E68E8|nr:hypothetical protein [Prosthecochloris sp. SCSIO W1101]UZJ42377.1 hypothetical protein OO006_05270 [Prosthecochloris sp. SCSIO W1101]